MSFDLTNLVSHWSLDEASGTRADSHGSNDLTDDSSVGSTTGKIGSAAVFVAASTDGLSHVDNADLSLVNGDISLNVWVKLTAKAASYALVAKYTSGGSGMEYGLYYNVASDRFDWYVGNGSSIFTATASTFGSPSTGVWYCIQCKINGTAKTLAVRVNGGAWNSSSYTGTQLNGTAKFYLGRRDNATGQFASANLDELSFWKRELSDAEFGALYASGNGITYPFTVAGIAPQRRRTAQASIRSTF